MKKIYEAWGEGEAGKWRCITFASFDSIADQRAKALLAHDAKLLYRVEADTYEEAMAVHHIEMDWAPYQPSGKPQPCPNSCGALFYPENSGECPNCGKVC